MKVNKPEVLFILVLTLALGLAFLIHTQILKSKGYSPNGNLITMAYVVNALLAAFIFIAVYRFRETLKYYIGYLFMAGSFLKFLVFFLFFYPTYTADGKIDKLEFAAFFIPYMISLVIETYFMAKMGNALNENE